MKPSIINPGNLCLLFVACFIFNLANSQSISKDELEQRAMESFQSGNYRQASNDFKTLHSLYQKDPRFAYYLGCSYFYANQNLDEACELLKLAAIRNFGDDTYFLLGRAYQLTYQFDDAEMALTTFKKTASNHLLKMHDVDYWLKVNWNAKELVVVSAKIQVISKELIPASSPEAAFTEKISGKYIYVADELKSKDDLALNYQTLMYVPADIKIGEYLYFSGHSKNSNQGLDIFRVKRLTAFEYSHPEPLSVVINSLYDEESPSFDASTNTLYFSSKGQNTSGGYDIFGSHFDSVTNEWTTPIPLAFPINTPFDETMYVITKDHSHAIFLSNRNQDGKGIMAITYTLQPSVEYITPSGRDQIVELAFLSSTINNNAGPLLENHVVTKKEDKPESTTLLDIPIDQSISKKSKYDLLLSEALELQARTDSIHWTVTELQKKVNLENDYRQRQELNASIITLNQEFRRLERLANEKFSEADLLRNTENGVQNQKNIVITIKQAESDPISTKNSSNDKDKMAQTANDNNIHEKGIEAAVAASEEINKGFKILNSSPYSNANPIPPETGLPHGLIYRVQLGAFGYRVPEDEFGGLVPVTLENIKEKNLIKYYVGYFTSISEARKALDSVKKYGYPDAFLVSYFNQQKISVEQAREIEFTEK